MPVANYRSPLWRFIATDLQTNVVTWLDHIAMERQVARVLNAPGVFTCRLPSDNPEVNRLWDAPGTLYDTDPYIAEGVRLIYGFRREVLSPLTQVWTPRFSGLLLQTEDVAESDIARTRISAFDPWQYLYNRPVRNSSGDLPGSDGLSFTATKANVIAASLLKWTIDADGPCYIDAGATYSGTAFYTGTFTDCPLLDINFQQGMMVGEAWDQLVATGRIDIVLDAIFDPDNRPGYCVQMNTAPEWGSSKPDAIFGWNKAPRSLVGITNLHDGTRRANEIQYYRGQGGSPVTLQTDSFSEGKFGVYFAQQFFPGPDGALWTAAVEALAESELQLRKDGQQTVTISPSPERAPSPYTEYDIGDYVPVYSSNAMREALLGQQRVYGIPIDISDDALETVRQVLASTQTGAVG